MKQMWKSFLMASGLLVAGLWSSPAPALDVATFPGELTVVDNAEAFTAEGIQAAEAQFSGVNFKSATAMTVVTFRKVPDDKRTAFEAVKDDRAAKAKFFGEWARDLAVSQKSRGVFVLISMEGGHVQAINDRQTDVVRSFDDKNLKQVQLLLNEGFVVATKSKDPQESKQARDAGLLKAVQYVSAELKNTSAPEGGQSARALSSDGNPRGETFLSQYGGYICMGIVGLMVVWLVIGVIRALTGGGGGGGGGYGGGGGGGGGGFMTSMMGGMFGAMAGMYLYNSMFGGGMSGSDAMASDSSTGDVADSGAGDYDGGGDGGGYDNGGDYGGGDDFGGGDFGGGDFGGGDFGGGDW